jgi:zinc protease
VKSRILLFALSLAVIGAVSSAGRANGEDIFPFAVHQTTLDNGFQVVVVPYDSPGTVAHLLVVRTGSRDEVEAGHSGFAHFFEHMMFRGTERYSTDAYNDVLKGMGADSNAFTSDDRTIYYIVGPAAELDTMMDIESDRFENLEYTEEAFKKEALAVLGEYNKNISNPFLPMYERMRELAFGVHTYSHTTMGYLADIQAMPNYYEYSLSFFDHHYRPENVSLLVVGDVDSDAVVEKAKKYYGGWETGHEASVVPEEPPQAEEKTAHIEWPGPITPHIMQGYRAPAWTAATVETATLDVISQLLFSESAPLYQKLVVEDQSVDSISGSYSDHRDPYLFMIFGRIKSEDQVSSVLATIDEYVERLKNEPVAEDRLERIKSYLRYSFALSLDSPGSVAFTLSNYLILTGDPDSVNQIYEQYQRVTPEDVQRVAREIFRPTGRTTVTLSHGAAAPSVAAGG